MPFSPESDSLIVTKQVYEEVQITSPKLKFVETIQEEKESPPLLINSDGVSDGGTNEQSIVDYLITTAPPNITNTGQVTNLQLLLMRPQTTDENTRTAKTNIEAMLNKLSDSDQRKFLEQFSILNRKQQQYAYRQFISSPPNVQVFALRQFLNLDPEVLKISIDREITTEKDTNEQPTSNPLRQIDHRSSRPPPKHHNLIKHRFQTNFS